MSYEEQASAIREQLAGLFEEEEQYSQAARTLSSIDLDSGTECHIFLGNFSSLRKPDEVQPCINLCNIST